MFTDFVSLYVHLDSFIPSLTKSVNSSKVTLFLPQNLHILFYKVGERNFQIVLPKHFHQCLNDLPTLNSPNVFFQKKDPIISACSSVLWAVFFGGLPIKIAGDNCTLSFIFPQPLTHCKL